MDLASLYPPHALRDYALIADGERGALIGPRGDICWLCAPSWESDAVFSTLIGGNGVYAITPTEPFAWGGYYEPGSLVWRSRYTTTSGTVEVAEALAFPGDPTRAVILRRVVAVDGPARMSVALDARAGFGVEATTDVRHHDGRWTARTGDLSLRWSGSPRARTVKGVVRGELTLEPGEHHDLVLEMSVGDLPREPPDPEEEWTATRHAWRQASPELSDVLAPTDARHSLTILRGLTSPTGGTVAAATMSLPERAEAGRNYDYRYAWIRDQCYVGVAAASVGAVDLLDRSVSFVAQRLLADGPQLKPAYTVTGGRVPDERRLDLPGYPGGYDQVGNHVNEQFQLDALGESLLLFAAAAAVDRLDDDHRAALQAAVAAVEAKWTQPDTGIWELDAQRWAHSRLSCVSGLRALGRQADTRDAAQWSPLADRILADVAADCVHESGRWQRSPTDARLDAALLFASVRGGVAADDPRTVATLAGVREELSRDGFVYRFRHDERPLSDAEGAFVLCGFLAALAEHQQGNDIAAARYFERNRSACGPPGLVSEEYDVQQRQSRGNTPQAFVHALLLQAASELAIEDIPARGID